MVVTVPQGDALPKSHMDEFHQLTSCGLEGHSSLTILKGDTFSKIWEKELPNIQFAKVISGRDGSAWLVGSINADCGEGTRIGLWDLNKDRVFKNLFTDQNPRDAQAHGVFREPDGSLLLLGTTNRPTDVDSFAERDPQFYAQGLRNSVSFSTRRINDAVIIRLDPSLNEKSRETLRAGSDLWITGAVSVRGSIWLYGALGNQAALMQLAHF